MSTINKICNVNRLLIWNICAINRHPVLSFSPRFQQTSATKHQTFRTAGKGNFIPRNFDLTTAAEKDGYISINTLNRLLYFSTINDKKLTPNQSARFLSHCGKVLADGTCTERLTLVSKVLHHTQSKNPAVYDALLKAYIENGKIFSPKQFLKEMKNENIQCSPSIYKWLIAGHCQNGEVKKAQKTFEYAVSQNVDVNSDIFAYVTYGRCINGEVQEAVKILEFVSNQGMKITSSAISTIACGMCGPDNKEHLLKLLNFSQNDLKLKLNHISFVDIALALQKEQNTALLPKIVPYINRISAPAFAYILQHLHQHRDYNGVLLQLFKKQTSIRDDRLIPIIVELMFPSKSSSAEGTFQKIITKNIDQLLEKRCPISFTLHTLLEQGGKTKNVNLCMEVVLRMQKNKIPIASYAMWPVFVSFEEKQLKKFQKFLRKNDISYEFEPRVSSSMFGEEESLARLWPFFAFKHHNKSEAFEELTIQTSGMFLTKRGVELSRVLIDIQKKNNIDTATFSRCILKSFVATLNMHNLIQLDVIPNYVKPSFQILVENGFVASVADEDMVFKTLLPKYHPLATVLFVEHKDMEDWKFTYGGYHAREVRTHSVLHENNIKEWKSMLNTGLKKDKYQCSDYFIANSINDAMNHLSDHQIQDVLDQLLQGETTLPYLRDSTVDQILNHYIKVGNWRAVEDVHKKCVKDTYVASYPVATLPTKYLLSKDDNVVKAMRVHLENLYDEEEANWILYFSYLFNGMANKAEKVLSNEMSWPQPGVLYRILLKPSTVVQLPSIIDVIVSHCGHLNGFSSMSMTVGPIYALMEQKRFEEVEEMLEKLCEHGHESAHSHLRLQIFNEFSRHGRDRPRALEAVEPLERFICNIGKDFQADLAAIEDLMKRNISIPNAVVCNLFSNLTHDQYQTCFKFFGRHYPYMDLLSYPIIAQKHVEMLFATDHGRASSFLKKWADNNMTAEEWRQVLKVIRNTVKETGLISLLTNIKSWPLNVELKAILSANIKYVELVTGSTYCDVVKDSFNQNNELARILHSEGERVLAEQMCAEAWLVFSTTGKNKLFNNFMAGLISQGFAGDMVAMNLERMQSLPVRNNFTSIFNKAFDNIENITSLHTAISLFARFASPRVMNRASAITNLLKTTSNMLPSLSMKEKHELAVALDQDIFKEVPSFLNYITVRLQWPLLMHALNFDAPTAAKDCRAIPWGFENRKAKTTPEKDPRVNVFTL